MYYRVNRIPRSLGQSPLLIVGACAAVLFALSGAVAGPPAAKKDAPKASLPPDLDRIPRDVWSFVSVRVADTLKQPFAARLRKLLLEEANGKRFQGPLGLNAEGIERFAIVVPEAERTVLLVTTIKPLDRERFLTFFTPEKRKKKVGDSVYYTGGKPAFDFGQKPSPGGVCFLNDHTAIVAAEKDLQRFLVRPLNKDKPGSLSDALSAAASGKHTLVVGASSTLFRAIPKTKFTEKERDYLPLMEAQSALLTLVLDETVRARLRLTFADEEKAKRAEPAAKEALGLAALTLILAGNTLKENPPPSLKANLPKLLKLIDATGKGLVEHPPQRKGAVLEHTIRISSPGWVDVLLEAALTFAAETNKTPTAPKKANPSSN